MLVEKARLAAEKFHMFVPGDRVVVGVSGGPDSVALLHWLSDFARENMLQVHIAHLNHMLRGEESAEDAMWVRHLASSMGLPSTIEGVDVQTLRKRLRLSLEDAARQARYSFFARVVQKVGGKCVAVAHTADDQVETVVLHWLRGSGLAGLRGMLPVMTYRVKLDVGSPTTGLRVVRPLLDVWRQEVEAYLTANNLVARIDRSNEQPVYLRNKIRLQLIPYLRSYNPRLKESVLRSARVLSSDYDFIQANVSQAWDRLVQVEERSIVFDLQVWSELPEAIQRHLLREAMSRLVGDVIGLAAIHVDSALSAIKHGRTGVRIAWPRGLVVRKSYSTFSVGYQEERPESGLTETGQRLHIPGRTTLHGTGWEVEATIESHPCRGIKQPLQAELDFAKVGTDLFVRRRLPGDRFRPLGMRGQKSLQDFFVDAKVPEEERDDVPIVVSPDQLIWVVGYRIDDRVKVTPSTTQILCLKFFKKDAA